MSWSWPWESALGPQILYLYDPSLGFGVFVVEFWWFVSYDHLDCVSSSSRNVTSSAHPDRRSQTANVRALFARYWCNLIEPKNRWGVKSWSVFVKRYYVSKQLCQSFLTRWTKIGCELKIRLQRLTYVLPASVDDGKTEHVSLQTDVSTKIVTSPTLITSYETRGTFIPFNLSFNVQVRFRILTNFDWVYL